MTFYAIMVGRSQSGKRLLLNAKGCGTTVRRNARLFTSRNGVRRALWRERCRATFFAAAGYKTVTTSFAL